MCVLKLAAGVAPNEKKLEASRKASPLVRSSSADNSAEADKQVHVDYRQLWEGCRQLGEGCRQQGEGCRSLGEDCTQLWEGCMQLGEAYTQLP